ncbi:MAG: hypothetical protein MZV70_58750 [Desulfobacterales bacterium]|nr:hypothetical protein [Desulfobacterales bacterium]
MEDPQRDGTGDHYEHGRGTRAPRRPSFPSDEQHPQSYLEAQAGRALTRAELTADDHDAAYDRGASTSTSTSDRAHDRSGTTAPTTSCRSAKSAGN